MCVLSDYVTNKPIKGQTSNKLLSSTIFIQLVRTFVNRLVECFPIISFVRLKPMIIKKRHKLIIRICTKN